jgi:hypothetical protein
LFIKKIINKILWQQKIHKMRILARDEEWAEALEEEGSPAVLVLARAVNAFVRNAEKK